MKVFYFATILLVLFSSSTCVNGKRFTLRPISAREVYSILREAGREDAIPEGRIVSQGIAAISGLGVGLLKGIGGSALVNLATSNQTLQMLSNYQGLNMTALSSLLGSFGSINSNKGNGTIMVTQEICFSTRSARELRATGTASTGTAPTAPTAPTTSVGTTGTTSPTGTATTGTSVTPTTTAIATSPTASTPTTTVGTATSTGTNGSGTATNTATMTQTGTGGAVNCIVIEKPKRK